MPVRFVDARHVQWPPLGLSGFSHHVDTLWSSRAGSLRTAPQIPFFRRTHHAMATDYDAPRTQPEDEPANESLEAIRTQASTTTQAPMIDLEDADTAEGIDLPGADLSHEELIVAIVPEQIDEFTCASCFLVRHRSQLVRHTGEAAYCTDCEG